jgi:RND family efflux transporter MFP subunit
MPRLRPAPTTPALALALAAALAGCAPRPAPPPAVPAVFVSTVRNEPGERQRVLPATVRARVESDIGFRAGGKVLVRTVEVGQSVRAGQVLGRVDARDYELTRQAALDQQSAAEVDARQSASDAARFQRLLADGSVGAADVERQQARADAAAARLAQARRQAELARHRADDTVLRAPFDGVVTALRFETGQIVTEGQPVVGLARSGELELQADVPEALAAGLAAWRASATVGGASQATAVTLRELAPAALAGTRTFRARYALGAAPPGAPWRIGMTAELRLSQPASQAGAELPVGALLAAGDAAVWLVDVSSGALRRQPVQVLSQSTEHVRVAGLPEGAQVVSVGAQKLDAGLQVRPVPRPLDGTVAWR